MNDHILEALEYASRVFADAVDEGLFDKADNWAQVFFALAAEKARLADA